MKIYLASSWRNPYQEKVVQILRDFGHEVYDFKNPAPGNTGFAWEQIDPEWKTWRAKQIVSMLKTQIAENGFKLDFDAMKWCDACLLVQPCGNSAHLELGWCAGAGKKTIVLLDNMAPPDLMLKMADHLCLDMSDVVRLLDQMTLAQLTPWEFDLRRWTSIWEEDDSGTHDREMLEEAWIRIFGEPFNPQEEISKADHTDAFFYLHPKNRVMCCSYSGHAIYVPSPMNRFANEAST